MFYFTLIIALLAALSSTFFCVISGAGATLDVLGACSVILLMLGAAVSRSLAKLGSVISMVGVGVGALLVLVIIGELVHAIPFRQQPRQGLMLCLPSFLLGILLLHIGSSLNRWKKKLERLGCWLIVGAASDHLDPAPYRWYTISWATQS